MLLLLVDDDKADVFQRGEDRAAGAHHDIRAAVLDHLPLEQALGVVESGMLHGHPLAKLAFQPQDHLGVRLISGTSTSARRPICRQCSMSFRNTSVLPLPVTP